MESALGEDIELVFTLLCERIGAEFRAAVIERFGACCDSLVGFISMLCGDGLRDALRAEDFTFSASSRTTYMASLLVFGSVISDAAMVDRVGGAMPCDEKAVSGHLQSKVNEWPPWQGGWPRCVGEPKGGARDLCRGF